MSIAAAGEEGGESASEDPAAPPLVSLFVLAYRQEDHVRAAIEGAFAQTYAPLEIILSDDCSPDGTFAVMEEMAAAYDGPHRVVLNRNPVNLGLTAHVSRVMEIAQGAFVVQNAGDDISLPHRVARLAEIWRAGGGRIMAVHSRLDRLDERGAVHDYAPRLPVMAAPAPIDVVRDGLHLIGASMGWAREIFERFGPLPAGTLVEDRPIAFRASILGEIAYVDEPLALYRLGGASDPSGAGERRGHSALYGYGLKRKRWKRSHLRAYLADMETLAPPDAEACRAVCRAEIERLDFEIGLAEQGYAGRLARLPQAVGLAIRLRQPGILRAEANYLLDRPYMWWLDRRGLPLP